VLSSAPVVGVISGPSSLERELRRLFVGWLSVDLLTSRADASARHLAVLDFGSTAIDSAFRNRELVVSSETSAINRNAFLAKPNVEMLRTAEKLELLGTLANILRQAERPTGREADRRNQQVHYARTEALDRIEELFRPSPLYRQFARIQIVFDLHVGVSDMSTRMACSEQTIRRWFRNSGKLRPERLFQWIRMYVVAHAVRHGLPAEVVSTALGFQYVESIRRSMRMLSGLSPTEMRSDVQFIAFSEQMRFATVG